MKSKDWMPSTRAGKNAMFTNFVAKIANYETTFGLTAGQMDAFRTICNSYIEIYDKTEQIRASNKDLTAWQRAIFIGEPRGNVAPNPPTFAPIIMPAGAFIGIYEEFRELVGYIKNHPAYTENIGHDLMIVGEDSNGDSLTDGSPELKLAAKNDTQVEIAFKKGEANAIEIQYRKAGTENWLLADKPTNSPILHSPQFTSPDQAEKFEYRAIFLAKNQRIGAWSPIYTITVG